MLSSLHHVPCLRTLCPCSVSDVVPLGGGVSSAVSRMSGRGGGKGWYYKQKYGGGGRGKGGGSRENTGASEPAETAWPAEDLSQRYEGSCKQLEEALKWIDGKQYPAYKDIAGTYHYPNFDLLVDHIQGDSYAAPSRMRVRVAWATAGFPDALVSNKSRRVALCDYVTRAFWKFAHEGGLDQAAQGSGWSGPKGGDLNIECPKQHVLQRTSVVVVRPKYIEARCTINLPAAGRTILASRAIEILCRKLPTVVPAPLLASRPRSAPTRDVLERLTTTGGRGVTRPPLDPDFVGKNENQKETSIWPSLVHKLLGSRPPPPPPVPISANAICSYCCHLGSAPLMSNR